MGSDVYVAVDAHGGVKVKVKVKVKVDVQSGDDGCTSGVVARVGIFDSIAASSATRLDLVDLP